MEEHTLCIKLLVTVCFAVNARCFGQHKFTKGIECSVENQKLCTVNTSQEAERVHSYQCFFTINVCLYSDNSVTFAYVPPEPKYGIVEGDVFLNKYVGQNNDQSDYFYIQLSSQKPCRFKDVLPGEYKILMRPIEPEDIEYSNNELCDSVSTNFASAKFEVRANNTDLQEIHHNNNITVSTSHTTNDEATTTEPTDVSWDNGNTSGFTEGISGVITTYHANSEVTGTHFADNNSSFDSTFTEKQTHTANHGLLSTTAIAIIAGMSMALVLISLSVTLLIRNRYHHCCSPHEEAKIKHNQDSVQQKEEHEKGNGIDKAELFDSGITDMETEGFLQSDVATLRERCDPTLVENGQNKAIPYDIYEYSDREKRCRDPSIFPAVTILSGTFESTNYVHPLFADIVCDSGNYGRSGIQSSDNSAYLSLSQNVYMKQNNNQTSDTTPSKRIQTKYQSVLNPNESLSESNEQHLGHKSEVSEGHGNMPQSLQINKLVFIPPDQTLSECNDITSRTIEQGMLEINRNYFRNNSSVFIDGSADTNGNNLVPTFSPEGTAQDMSDISISGISL